MSEQLLTILKLCLLALLYLFFFRVVRAVWAQLRSPAPAPAGPQARAAAPKATTAPPAAPKRRGKGVPTHLVAVAPESRQGASFEIGRELTVGRAGGCAISLPEDTFVSSLHARVYTADGGVLVEDLGSTNGTLVNQHRVTSTMPLARGDRLKIGNTVLEAR